MHVPFLETGFWGFAKSAANAAYAGASAAAEGAANGGRKAYSWWSGKQPPEGQTDSKSGDEKCC